MSPKNGESEEGGFGEVLVALAQIGEQLEEIQAQQEEILERLANLSTPGCDYSVREEEV